MSDVEEIPVSLSIVEGIHRSIINVLKNLSENQPEAFDRTFYHPESGNSTLGQYVISFAGHGISHLDSIRELLKS